MKNQRTTQHTQGASWRDAFANFWSTLTFGEYHRDIKNRFDRTLQESSELIKESQENLKNIKIVMEKADLALKNAEQQGVFKFKP